MINIHQTLTFKRSVKKLHPHQKNALDEAVRRIMEDPLMGVQKKGDLAEARIYKFEMINTLNLLAYAWEPDKNVVTLLNIGSHKNFYRNSKNT